MTTSDDLGDPSASNNNKKKKKNDLVNDVTEGYKKFIHDTQKGLEEVTKATQKSLHDASETTQKSLMDAKSTCNKAAKDSAEFVTKTVGVVGFDSNNNSSKSKSKSGDNNNKKQTTTTTKPDDDNNKNNDAVDDKKSKNLSKAAKPMDIKSSSMTLDDEETPLLLSKKDKKQQPKKKKKAAAATTATATAANNIYNTPPSQNTTTTTTTTITSNSLFTMPNEELVPRLLVIILVVIVTFSLYYDDIFYNGHVPVFLIPIWFIMGIIVSQIFLIRPVINIIPTTTTPSRGIETDDESFIRRPVVVSPGGNKRMDRDDETPIDEASIVQRQQTKSSTRKDFFTFFDDLFNPNKKKQRSSDVVAGSSARTGTSAAPDFSKYFTNLGHKYQGGSGDEYNPMKRKFWDDLAEAESNDELMDIMLVKFGMKKKEGLEETKKKESGEDEEEVEEEVKITDVTMGHISNENLRAHTLEKDLVIDPLFNLRGVDVFRPNGPAEEKIWRQPILEENGLFDVPTFVVNLMLPWYNLVLYFQMPDWVKNFNDIVEHDDDKEEIKALKRFLNGDAEYRYPRWKILPCLVDGPYVIKAIAPEKTEIAIGRPERVPVSWHQYDQQKDPKTGKVTRRALLEADIDLMNDSKIRKVLGIIKGQVPKVIIDCAMIIDKPYLSEEPEPKACIGLWRLDKLDMEQAAIIPEKDERQLLQEFMSIIPEGTQKNSIRNLLAQ